MVTAQRRSPGVTRSQAGRLPSVPQATPRVPPGPPGNDDGGELTDHSGHGWAPTSGRRAGTVKDVRTSPLRVVRPFLAAKWLAAHLLLVVVGLVMIRLGIWQWHVAVQRNGDLRNYAYAFQWWAFTVFAVVFWVRLMRDAQRTDDPGAPDVTLAAPAPSAHSEPQYRPYQMPRVEDIVTDESSDLAQYNAYLKSLPTGRAAQATPEGDRSA